jgi:hypothetical protein
MQRTTQCIDLQDDAVVQNIGMETKDSTRGHLFGADLCDAFHVPEKTDMDCCIQKHYGGPLPTPATTCERIRARRRLWRSIMHHLYLAVLFLLLLFLPYIAAQVPCNSTQYCEATLQPGSTCQNGLCSNPYFGGCLHNQRVCNSDNTQEAIS